MKTAVIGTGSWGTALAQVLADNGQEVIMYGIDAAQIRDINENHRNSAFFDTEISHMLRAVDDLNCVRDSDIVLLAVPTAAIESTVRKVDALLDHPVIIINVAKGFHPESHKRLSEVIRENIRKENLKAVVSLIGPSHAEEVILRLLTAVNAVSVDESQMVLVSVIYNEDKVSPYYYGDDFNDIIFSATVDGYEGVFNMTSDELNDYDPEPDTNTNTGGDSWDTDNNGEADWHDVDTNNDGDVSQDEMDQYLDDWEKEENESDGGGFGGSGTWGQ